MAAERASRDEKVSAAIKDAEAKATKESEKLVKDYQKSAKDLEDKAKKNSAKAVDAIFKEIIG